MHLTTWHHPTKTVKWNKTSKMHNINHQVYHRLLTWVHLFIYHTHNQTECCMYLFTKRSFDEQSHRGLQSHFVTVRPGILGTVYVHQTNIMQKKISEKTVWDHRCNASVPLRPSYHEYLLHLTAKWCTGWIDPSGCLHTEMVYLSKVSHRPRY